MVTGQIVSPTLEATRTEPEFVEHIARTVQTDDTAEWIFVVDNLNTHQSASLVEWVAAKCGLGDALGKKSGRHPEVASQSPRISLRSEPSYSVRVPPKTQLVAQPD